jgi:hypothetical protein
MVHARPDPAINYEPGIAEVFGPMEGIDTVTVLARCRHGEGCRHGEAVGGGELHACRTACPTARAGVGEGSLRLCNGGVPVVY